jgi:hypothetical protein
MKTMHAATHESQPLEIDSLEIVGHSKVDDHRHGFLGDRSLAQSDGRIGSGSSGPDGPRGLSRVDPGDVRVIPIVRVRSEFVPVHSVSSRSSSVIRRVGVGESRDGLLVDSTEVRVVLYGRGIVQLGVLLGELIRRVERCGL